MTEKQISIGDLVMVIRRKPCCDGGLLGFPFKVAKIGFLMAVCQDCGDRHIDWYALDEAGDIYRMSRLQKIPPITKEATVTIKETVKV